MDTAKPYVGTANYSENNSETMKIQMKPVKKNLIINNRGNGNEKHRKYRQQPKHITKEYYDGTIRSSYGRAVHECNGCTCWDNNNYQRGLVKFRTMVILWTPVIKTCKSLGWNTMEHWSMIVAPSGITFLSNICLNHVMGDLYLY